jgi:hypothetical protein
VLSVSVVDKAVNKEGSGSNGKNPRENLKRMKKEWREGR